ncbi:MAG TPA: hypothetical protein VM011_05715 [Gammaproteobacteria bacterium]|nr:hypothetical protein [Gammaproteobacteria bacterium]
MGVIDVSAAFAAGEKRIFECSNFGFIQACAANHDPANDDIGRALPPACSLPAFSQKRDFSCFTGVTQHFR